MSTSYHLLRAPITNVQLMEFTTHDCLRIWETGDLAGELFLSKGAGKEIIYMLTRSGTAMHVYSGGAAIGCVVAEFIDNIHDDTPLVGDSGEIVTARDVRALAGLGRIPLVQ